MCCIRDPTGKKGAGGNGEAEGGWGEHGGKVEGVGVDSQIFFVFVVFLR